MSMYARRYGAMDKIGVKRLITLIIVFTYCALEVASFFYGRSVPGEFSAATMMIIGFYFKKE